MSDTPAGWYADPKGQHTHRYFDGNQWTGQIANNGVTGTDNAFAPPPPPATPAATTATPDAPDAPKKKRHPLRWIFGALVVIIIVSVAASSSSNNSNSDSPASSDGSSASSSPKASKCGYQATEHCTPSVFGQHSVRVDSLIWHIADTPATSTQLGGGTTQAHGIFVIFELSVKSAKKSAIQMTSDVVHLTNHHKVYDSDALDSQVAADGSSTNDQALNFVSLQPGDRQKMLVVFDVPKAALEGHPQLRFNELGFGDTKAYITFDKPAAFG